jgi:hypothetical protein
MRVARGAGLLARYFFWKQELLMAVLVAVLPPLVVSGVLIRVASLERYATSKRGEYIKTHLTRAREVILSGLVVIVLDAARARKSSLSPMITVFLSPLVWKALRHTKANWSKGSSGNAFSTPSRTIDRRQGSDCLPGSITSVSS